jgi:hypothetical protein
MGWMIGGFESRKRLGIFLFTTVVRPTLGPTQPPIQWVPEALSLGAKRSERETGAEVKNAWSYISITQYTFMARRSEKAQGQLYFHLYLCVFVLLLEIQTLSAIVSAENEHQDPYRASGKSVYSKLGYTFSLSISVSFVIYRSILLHFIGLRHGNKTS